MSTVKVKSIDRIKRDGEIYSLKHELDYCIGALILLWEDRKRGSKFIKIESCLDEASHLLAYMRGIFEELKTLEPDNK